MKLHITHDTFLKLTPSQSDDLKLAGKEDSLFFVQAGKEFAIQQFSLFEGAPGADDDHLCILLAQSPHPRSKERSWFAYCPHAKIEGAEPENDPTESKKLPGRMPDVGKKIQIPGISRPVGIFEPIYYEPQKSNFTWAEFTKNGTRIPVNANVTSRLIKLARYMDEIRAFLGDRPIRITSGYRDPVSNRYVGGARDSRHMYGDAVDFWVEGMDVVDVFYKLKQYHPHGGLAVGNGFVHLDLRPGSPARWTYPGGPRVALW